MTVIVIHKHYISFFVVAFRLLPIYVVEYLCGGIPRTLPSGWLFGEGLSSDSRIDFLTDLSPKRPQRAIWDLIWVTKSLDGDFRWSVSDCCDA